MAQANATAYFYAYIDPSWVLLDDVSGAIPTTLSWGMNGNGPLDRVADPGDMTLWLDNSTGQYTPGGPSALAGFKKGIPVKLVITYEGVDRNYLFYIDDLEIKPNMKNPRTRVTLVDWLDYAERHPIVNPGILTNKRGDEVLTTAVGEVEIQPTATDFDTGRETFPTVFDTVTSKTTVYKEMQKVAFSEPGYCYQKHDGTLVFESADARHGWRTAGEVPLSSADSGFLLKEDAAYLLKEDGGKIILNQAAAQTIGVDTPIEDFDAPYGDNQINKMTVIAYPRRLGASPEVLFQLDYEVVIGSGQTYTLKGFWADPDGGLPINAQDVIEPVPASATDCSAFTATAGGGSNITSDLTITSWAAGTEGFTAQLRNDNAATMFLYTFKPRGTAIRTPNPTEHAATDLNSITEYEVESQTLHQRYKNDTYAGRVFTESQVNEHKDPRTVLRSITFTANKSPAAMMAFLYTDVGDLRYIEISELGLTGNFYVQGIEVTMNGGIFKVTWTVIASLSILTGCGLSPLAVEFGGLGTEDAVNFGYMPHVSDLSQRTYSAWINRDSLDAPNTTAMIIGQLTDLSGVGVYTGTQGTSLVVVIKCTGGEGAWGTTTGLLPGDSNWHHVVATINMSTVTPLLYIDGANYSLTESPVHSGSVHPEVSVPLIIGNELTATIPLNRTFNGQIADVRVYNRILTAAEVTAIYNAGTPSMSAGTTDGLVFQPFAVRTEELASYTDATLTSSMLLRDNVFGAVGEPHGAPVGRAAP